MSISSFGNYEKTSTIFITLSILQIQSFALALQRDGNGIVEPRVDGGFIELSLHLGEDHAPNILNGIQNSGSFLSCLSAA